ncbi:MAG: EscJ/YscJ/HrcJ family type III secretion inner membrane ring protein [Alcaligenaceae bacterium]|nr:EscJ/YscJ/HrcJ family type III secretion inner membrane ring protein [Alcaligenaceae bacterium SAGV5]MPS55000.1 EscJ/YscJ/HrcJ family type III secretion inner membrane ring protein [Alcaligenaceae bacterium SAGV3]MPT55594.1 EscJ/YscJ/HrcJ family type III secretion inner membrane ring protein [Alcaligenaceae bacterium]
MPIPSSLPRSGNLLRVACVFLLLMLLAACSKMVTLQAGLTDMDANEIVLALNRKGIQVDKQKSKEGVTLLVKDSELSRATETMNAAGLPRRSLSNLGEVFKKQGMISSPMEERVRYLHGLSAELESTMLQFDKVVVARVHVVLPERIAPGEPVQPSSAAVFIKYRPPLDEDVIVPRVRRLVASSIPGLSSDDGRSKVSVVMTPGEPPVQGIEWTTLGPFRVAADSAAGLVLSMTLPFLVALAACGYIAFQAALRNPRAAQVLMKLAMRRAAKDQAKNEDAAPARQGT